MCETSIQATSSYSETLSLQEINFLVIVEQNQRPLISLCIGCCVWEKE